MKSLIAEELQTRLLPVAVIYTDRQPEPAPAAEGRPRCVIQLLRAVAEGRTAVLDRQTLPCPGAGTGLEFADRPPDPDRLAHFLSTGEPGGREGEGYKKTPELARAFLEQMTPAGERRAYRVFKPLAEVDLAVETPELVIFLANPVQLSALVVLANYGRATNDNVCVEFGSGCWSCCRGPHQLGRGERQRAMIGLTDISARGYLPPDVLSFTIPWAMFLEMEGNVKGSFLEKQDWQKVKARMGGQ